MAEERTINLNVNTKGAQKNVNDLEKAVEGVNNEVKETGASTEAMSGTLDNATGGAITKFKGLKGGLTAVIKSFKTLRIAILATGLGALLIAVTSLGQAFTRSEEGQNKFAKILGVIGSVTGNLLDLLADLGEGIISVFEDPKQALINFKNLLVENITNRFKAMLDTVGFLGSAIKSVFKGDFDEALESAKKAGSSFVDSFTGVENSIGKATNAVKEFGKEIAADANAAAKIADQRAQAEKLARNLVVERAEAERKIAELREKAVNKDKFTAAERIKFLEEAGKVSDELAAKEIAVSQLRLEAKRTENALTKSGKEDLDEQSRLEAEVIQKETQRLNLQKRLSTELLTSKREEAAAQKVIVDAENKRNEEAAEKEQARLDAIDKIQQDYINKKEDRDADTELKKIELEEQRKLAELERLNATETQKMEVEAYYDQLRDEARAAQNAKQLEETKKLNEELAQAEVNLQQAKAGAIKGGLQVIGALAGKSKAVAKTLLVVEKGLAIAQVISNAARAIAQAKANLAATPAVIGLVPNPAYLIQAAATAKGIATTKLTAATSIATIAAQAVAGLGGGGGGASAGGLGGGAADTQPQAPSFNIVGATETSQLAQAVGGQSQQPVQAYVVANDVTTAQSLENNIVEGATI